MEEDRIKKCLINREENLITVDLKKNENEIETIYIDVLNENNSNEILKFIDKANRYYSSILHTVNKTEVCDSYGSLTSKVIGLYDIPITLVNPKYIINVFLKILKYMYMDETKYLNCFKRDESLNIPTSQENISKLINEIITNNNFEENNDENMIDIKDTIVIILEQIANLQNNKIQKRINNGSLQKRVNIFGGISNFDINSLKPSFDETLLHTGDKIHNLIYEYKLQIYEHCKDNIEYVKQCMDIDPSISLYQNVNISFEFMMDTIGKIFNIVFTNILPQKSMLDCVYATLYQAAFLNELNILKYYSKIIQLPIMYRLIYSFYKDNSLTLPLQSYDNSISKLIDKLSKKEKDIDTICNIALKINIQNLDELNNIYWILNDKRGLTYEYYIIVIISIYIMGKCRDLIKSNKILNGKNFGEPIYDLFHKFRQYIVNDIKNLENALCSNTFDNFNKLYSTDIKICMKNFIQNIHK